MKKLFLLLAIVCITGISYAQQKSTEKKSETVKKTVVARLTIKKEEVESFVQFAQKIVEATKKEPGCISYGLYKNAFSKEAEFVFYEEYKDQAALDFHNQSEHLKLFFSQITPQLAVAPIVEVF